MKKCCGKRDIWWRKYKKRIKNMLFLLVMLSLCICACARKDAGDGAGDGAGAAAEEGAKDSSSFEVMPEFSTVDLEGNTVTDDIFSEAEITVVNFWATYCSPCINEMPQLEEWSQTMPEQAQIIGIAADVHSEDSDLYTLAQQVVEKTGVSFVNLVAAEEFTPVIKGIVGVPTTFFVDKDGKFIGSPIVGADVEGYKNFVEGYLDGLE